MSKIGTLYDLSYVPMALQCPDRPNSGKHSGNFRSFTSKATRSVLLY